MAPETERLLQEGLRDYRKTRRVAVLFYLVLWIAVLSICVVLIGWNTGFIQF